MLRDVAPHRLRQHTLASFSDEKSHTGHHNSFARPSIRRGGPVQRVRPYALFTIHENIVTILKYI